MQWGIFLGSNYSYRKESQCPQICAFKSVCYWMCSCRNWIRICSYWLSCSRSCSLRTHRCGTFFFVLVKCLRQQQGYLKFQFSMIEMHSSVFCCAQRTGKTQDGKSHLFRSWIGNPTLKKNLIMGSQVAKVCLTLPLSSHPCCSYKKRVFGQLSRKKGITKYRKYFRSGVKSHKSTCQELYQKDRELHKVWDSLPWKERDRVM